jgi:hypothetical protein
MDNDQFLQGKLISDCERIADKLYSGDEIHARTLWNKSADTIEKILHNSRGTQFEAELTDIINSIISSFSKGSICADLIKYNLIPKLYSLTESVDNSIVEFDNYKLLKSKSGLWALFDKRNNYYLNSLYNPMEEAQIRANILYKTSQKSFCIMGADLGYLPYSVWEKSYHSIKITIFENDANKIEWAKKYGVLDLIDPQSLNIVVDESVERLFDLFTKIDEETDNTGYYISQSIAFDAEGSTFDAIRAFKDNQFYVNEYSKMYEVNYQRNKLNSEGSFDNFVEFLKTKDLYKKVDHCLVIAGGPSVKDNIEAIKNKADDYFIISVNTSVKYLLSEGLCPDCVVVMDPTDGIVPHLEGAQEQLRNTPLISESVSNWKYNELYEGPRYTVEISDYFGKHEDTKYKWTLNTTVTAMALEVAVNLGAKAISVVGADLGYPDNMQYPGVAANKKDYEQYVLANNGEYIGTSNMLLRFKGEIERIIQSNEEISFINLSKNGAYIKGAFRGKWWEKTPLTGEYTEYVSKLKNEKMLGWKEKYYLMWQMIIKYISCGSSEENAFWNEVAGLFEEIKAAYINELEWAPQNASKQSNLVVLMTSDFIVTGDELSQKILEDAYKLRHNSGKDVLIINTSEYASGEKVAIENSVIPEKSPELFDKQDVIYMGERYAYFQMPENMPDIETAKIVMDQLADIGPELIIAYDPFSLMMVGCNKFFNVESR